RCACSGGATRRDCARTRFGRRRGGRSSTSDRPGGAAAARSGAGNQRPDRLGLGRRRRAEKRRPAIGRRHPFGQRRGPEQPAGARRTARPTGRRPLGPDPVRARRSGPLHHRKDAPMKARNRSLLIGVLAAVLAAQPLAAAPVMAQEARQTLNVQNADIRAFVQDVARTTGRTFIVDPAVTGTVTVSSPRPLTRAQLFQVSLSTRRSNGPGVTAPAAGSYRISPAQGAAQGPATVGAERFSTEVFTLRHIDAASAAETIRPLVGAQGQVLANPGANSVVVADF